MSSRFEPNQYPLDAGVRLLEASAAEHRRESGDVFEHTASDVVRCRRTFARSYHQQVQANAAAH